jgi:DNA-directed RNA polymerase subunit RPC12/RpoP
MTVEGGVTVVHLRCERCGAESFALILASGAPCPDCRGRREIVRTLPDRRTGEERRGPGRLQRMWDFDPRSWFDRRRA